MILKRKEIVHPILKWSVDEMWNDYLNFRGMLFYISQVSDRAFWIAVVLPNVWNTYANNESWLIYDKDFEEWYESIESAKWAVETYLSNVLWFIFEENEKDNTRSSKEVFWD